MILSPNPNSYFAANHFSAALHYYCQPSSKIIVFILFIQFQSIFIAWDYMLIMQTRPKLHGNSLFCISLARCYASFMWLRRVGPDKNYKAMLLECGRHAFMKAVVGFLLQLYLWNKNPTLRRLGIFSIQTAYAGAAK